MKKIFLIAGLLGMLSCGKVGDEWYTIYTKSFVTEYYSLSGIEAIWVSGRPYRSGVYIELRVIPDGKVYGILSDDEDDKARYENLCVLHGDNGYNRTVSGESRFSLPNRFQDRDYVGIAITSDQDWDEAHPAGTSLNDVFYFASSSPARYIDRGYAGSYDWKDIASRPEYYKNYMNDVTIPTVPAGYEPVYGLMSDMTADDLILLGGTKRPQLTFAALTPVAEPALSKTHNISIVLTDTAGNELTAQVAAAF